MKSQMLFLAALLCGQALARSPVEKNTQVKIAPVPAVKAPAKKVSLINPPLEDVKSDKKFFGPPFPADYPEDKRPTVDHGILDKLRGAGQPYPALQAKADYDSDYVKDENSDKGSWKAQMEYDTLRRKLAAEKAAEKAAQDRANKEGSDEDAAAKAAADAAKKAADAKKDADAAANEGKGGDGKDGDGTDGKGDSLVPPSAAELEKLKKKVAEAEANLAKEEKQFEECKKKLDDAKKNLDELKAAQDKMEKQLEGETKLWAETKTVKLSLKHAKEEAAHAKKTAAEGRLKEAQTLKESMDKVLAREKAESDKAHATLKAHQETVEKAKAELAKATLSLQKLRGYSPPPAKSGAQMTSALSLLAFVAVQALL